MPFDTEFWTQILGDVVSGILAWLPQLAGALLLLLVGWLVARLIQALLAGLLGRIGLDQLAQRAGIAAALENIGLEPAVSILLSRLVYWLVLLVFIIAATESLGLTGVVTTLEGLVDYLPSVLAAGLIILLGGLLARVIGDSLGALSSQAGIAGGQLIGQAVRYILLVFVVILAMEQLGIETTLLITAATALIAATALALALSFGIGSRELARNIMAGFHAKDAFEVGQSLQVRGHTGRLLDIGTVKTVIETDSGLVSLPNSIMTEDEVIVLVEAEAG